MEDNDQKTALVVMEAGARWPSYTRELAGRASSAVVESQPAIESVAEFSARVIGRVARLAERSVRIPVAILAASQRIDPEARKCRYQMARAIVMAMAGAEGGELLIMGDEHFGEEVRHELVAFAGALCDGLAGSAVSVRVRFGTGRSGTHALAIPPSSRRAAVGDD
ncbi:MAG: hypothetical protein L6Q84_01665 [Polyangiaceae bacterium]|nr:hypothetical protein [Polyangiaceae bacterium]